MRIILLTAALVCLSIAVMAQDYAQPFKLQPYAFNPPILQQGLPGLTNPGELPAIIKPDRSTEIVTGTTDMNIQTNPQPVPVQPVQVQPIPQSTPPKPEPVEQAKPERIPWPEPGYNCCWPQNIDGSLHVDPDSFGGGN